MILGFREHRLRYTNRIAGGTDADGAPVADTEACSCELPCHIEPQTHSFVQYGDGKAVNYSFNVYLDADAPDFEYGDVVTLVGPGGKTLRNDKAFTVKRMFRYQNYVKLWV